MVFQNIFFAFNAIMISKKSYIVVVFLKNHLEQVFFQDRSGFYLNRLLTSSRWKDRGNLGLDGFYPRFFLRVQFVQIFKLSLLLFLAFNKIEILIKEYEVFKLKSNIFYTKYHCYKKFETSSFLISYWFS